MAENDPIGIFDSGVGGLAVYRAIKHQLPNAKLIYFGDTRFGPYGNQSQDYIEERAIEAASLLVEHGVKALVVACNTATVSAIDVLRETFRIPTIGIEPGLKPALESSASKRILLLATQQTLDSRSVGRLSKQYGQGAEIFLEPCPELVKQVELGDLDTLHTKRLLRRATRLVEKGGVDTVVLGCTHFAFLETQIRKLIGSEITIIEPSQAVAQQLVRTLETVAMPGNFEANELDLFFTSATSAETVSITGSKLLGEFMEFVSVGG